MCCECNEIILLSEMQLKVALLVCLISLSLALQPRAHDYRSSKFRYSDFFQQMQSQNQTPTSALAVSITFLVFVVILLLAYFLCPQQFKRNPKQFSSQSQGQPTLDQNINANAPVMSKPVPPQPQANYIQSVRGTMVNANRAVNPYVNPGTDRQARF